MNETNPYRALDKLVDMAEQRIYETTMLDKSRTTRLIELRDLKLKVQVEIDRAHKYKEMQGALAKLYWEAIS